MNHFHFEGRLAKAPAVSGSSDRAYCKFTLIRNEYAGKDDESGQTFEREVAIQFTAFRRKAEAIAKHCRKGDQLLVTARVENNNYEKDGQPHYGLSFLVEDFSFGAPGGIKRDELARRREEAAES
ncbi:MAG TPA: single-stranded DNA-binding protein [Burkholderiaceae bacterium]|nr:single-stranded DNA-binding protein [Burkholderiaceae bacterium]